MRDRRRAEAISDFRVMGDQDGLFGPVASVPAAWRALDEIGDGGERALGRITTAVNTARRAAWAQAAARHGALPGVRIAERVLDGVTISRGSDCHPLLAYCDDTGEPLAGMLRSGSAGSTTRR